jgi:signal transduction histidine kinase
VRVRDTGPGIAAAHQDRLCEPFWQADSSFTRAENGTGLGLTTASRFALMLGGAIEAGSTVGNGTTLTLRLPLIPRCGE